MSDRAKERIQLKEEWNVLGQRELTAEEVSEWGVPHEPDDFKAYVELSIVKSLPKVIGPESHGLYFGYHPAVLAKSHHTLLHKATNFHHSMKAHGSYRDKLTGCVVATKFPDPPSGDVWEMPETVEEAPSIQVLAVIWKNAEGVSKMLGEFLANTKPWSISIEANFERKDISIFDPKDRSFTDLDTALTGDMQEAVKYDPHNGGLRIGTYRGHQLAVAPGGSDGVVPFHGFAYTDTPAEDTAEIHRIAASEGVVKGAVARWTPILAGGCGFGVVRAMHTEGVYAGKLASEDSPLLELELPSGRVIYRTLAGCTLDKPKASGGR